jgi:hypothetical protein
MVRSWELSVELLGWQDPVTPILRRIHSTLGISVEAVSAHTVCGFDVNVFTFLILKM